MGEKLYGGSHKVVQLTSESCSFSENSEKYAFLCCECNVRYVVPNQRPGLLLFEHAHTFYMVNLII